MIDTHCHLTFPDFHAPGPDPLAGVAAELAECARLGVTGCITISTTTSDCLDALAIARRFENVWCTSGVHPLYAAATDDRPRAQPVHEWANLRTVAMDPKCVAWGELGLDNHYPDPPLATQRAVLEEQLAFIAGVHAEFASSPRFPLPIVIHCREAFDDLIPVLKAASLDPGRFVFHCFTGTPADARAILDLGAMMSFTGVVTFQNANTRDLREVARLVPADRFMVETDAPYLAPVPVRGRKNEPANVAFTCAHLAGVRGDDPAELAVRAGANARAVFGLPAPADVRQVPTSQAPPG